MNGTVKRDFIGGLCGITFVLLFMTGAIVSNVATTTIYPRPEAEPVEMRRYFAENVEVVEFLALALCAAAVSLVAFAGSLVTKLRNYGESTLNMLYWAGGGGAIAAGLLLLNGLLIWALSREQVVAGAADALTGIHQLAFATGGAGHVVALGLFVGPAALAALRAGIQPRWLTVVGIASSALSLASLVTLLVLGPMIVLIPLGRFTAFIYIIVTSIRMLREKVVL